MIDIKESLDIKENLTDKDGAFLRFLAKKVAKKDAIFIEIGSWKGHSTSFLGQVAKECDGHLYCVDHWKGTVGVKEHKGIDNCLDIFRHNMEVLGLNDYVHPLVMESQRAVRIFADNIADLVFIDADHSYAAIKADIQAWVKKVRVGGYLCGHDAESFYTYVPFKDEWLDTPYIKKIVVVDGKDQEISVHPGVLKALYDCFDDKHGIAKDTHIWMIQKR